MADIKVQVGLFNESRYSPWCLGQSLRASADKYSEENYHKQGWHQSTSGCL